MFETESLVEAGEEISYMLDQVRKVAQVLA